MKHLRTFESYIAYSDYEKKRSKWGSASDIEEDLRMKITNLLSYGGVSNRLEDIEFEDQSSDSGIKWEIKVIGDKGIDKIHAYKKTTYRGEYELYLNKKKSSEYDVQQYFLDKYISDLDKYIASMRGYDSTYQYSDDSRSYKSGAAHSQRLKELYDKLSSQDKKQAAKAYSDKFNTKIDSKSFNGVA